MLVSPFDIRALRESDLRVTSGPEETANLLERWHAGDRQALQELLSRNLEWVEQFVRRRLGPQLRQKEETGDVVQDACIDILEYGPRFVVPDRDRFRALLGRMVENNLRDKHGYYSAKRRDVQREQSISKTVLRLGETPSQVVARDEHVAMTRLAVDLLPPKEREVLVLREYDELPYEQIAERVSLSVSGTRKCYQRALVQLASKVKQLRSGNVDDAVGGDE